MEKKPGILKLIETNQTLQLPGGIWIKKEAPRTLQILPIIVTDEPIQVGDKYLSGDIGTKMILERYASEPQEGSKKILVLPEQIPDNIKQSIAEGKLKDGDSVNVHMILRPIFSHTSEKKILEDPVVIELTMEKAIVDIPEQISEEALDEILSMPSLGLHEEILLEELGKEASEEQSITSNVEEAAKSYSESLHLVFGFHLIANAFKAGKEWGDKHLKPIPEVDWDMLKITLGEVSSQAMKVDTYIEKYLKPLVNSLIYPKPMKSDIKKALFPEFWFQGDMWSGNIANIGDLQLMMSYYKQTKSELDILNEARGALLTDGKTYSFGFEPYHVDISLGQYLRKYGINEIPSIRQITSKEKEKGRSENYYQLTYQEQWEEDKRLGILDWKGE